MSSALSVSGLVAFTTLTRSLQLVSPSLVASLRCVELVAAFAVQSLLTSTAPSLVASTGGGLIILGVLVLAFQPQLDHYRRDFLNFDIDTSYNNSWQSEQLLLL